MIDKELFDQLDKHQRDSAISGLSQLVNSGILELQKQQLLARMLAGYERESDEAVTAKVKEYRRGITAILSLEGLAIELNEEQGR